MIIEGIIVNKDKGLFKVSVGSEGMLHVTRTISLSPNIDKGLWHCQDDMNSFLDIAKKETYFDSTSMSNELVYTISTLQIDKATFVNVPIIDKFSPKADADIELPLYWFAKKSILWDYISGKVVIELEDSDTKKIIDSVTSLSIEDQKIYEAAPTLWKRKYSIEEVVEKMKSMRI